MISLFRNFAKSKWAIGLIVLLGIGLLVTGGTQMDVIGALQPPQVIRAGERSLDAQEFRTVVENLRFNQQQQGGRAPTIQELADDPQFATAFTQRAQELGFLAWAHKVGIRPGEELMLRQIRALPAFFDPVTRKFDENAYKTKLAEARLTPALLEEQLRDQYIQLHYASAMGAGARLPRIYGAVVANQTRQTRDGRWFTLTQAMAGASPQPTDAQLQSFMSQNAAQLRRPELRQAAVVVFDNPADINAPISEEKIQERFDFRRDSLAQPERRTFVTLTAPNRQVADRIAAALRASQTPQAVASANGVQPADYADTPRTAIGDPAVAAAVFGLQANQVSDPIQANVGFVVARVASIIPGREVALADVRDQIVSELRQSEAKAKVFQRVEAYEAARRQGRTVDQAIQQVGARTITLPPMTQDGRTPDGQQVNVPPAMLETLWKLTRGGVSEVASLEDSQYYAVRLNTITPASMPTLAEVRAPLTQNWIARENARLLTARADALTARLRRGEDIAAVAASVNAPLTTQAGVAQSPETAETLGQAALVGLFSTQRGQPFSQPSPTGGVVIGRVDRITAPTPALAAEEAQTWRQRLVQTVNQTFLQALVQNAARRLKAEFDIDQARRALGLEAAPAAPATGGAPAKT